MIKMMNNMTEMVNNVFSVMNNRFNFLDDLTPVNTYSSFVYNLFIKFPLEFTLICGVLMLFCLILYMNPNIYLPQTKTLDVNNHKKDDDRPKTIIDLCWTQLKKGTKVFDDGQKCDWELSYTFTFIFDNLDRSGENIRGLLKSNSARRTTIYMDGLPFTGYQLRGVEGGNRIGSKLVLLDPILLASRSNSHILLTAGHPITIERNKHCIWNTQNRLIQNIPNNRDIRNRIDYVTS